MQRMAGVLLLLAIFLTSNTAGARTSLAVLGVDAVDVPVSLANCLSKRIKKILDELPEYQLQRSKSLDEIKLVFGCVDEEPECMAWAGKTLRASKLLWGALRQAKSGYSFTLKLLDVDGARIEKFASESISRAEMKERCGRGVVDGLARSILAARHAQVRISSNVEKAKVLLGNEVVGEIERGSLAISDLSPGTYLVRVERAGYRPSVQEIELQADESIEIQATLALLDELPLPEPVVAGTARPTNGWRYAFWTGAAITVGLAVGMSVSGYSVLGIEDEKDDLVEKYDIRAADACADPANSELRYVCDRGKARANLTNLLVGATIAAAVGTGISCYMAYFRDGPGDSAAAPERAADPDSSASRAPQRRQRVASSPRWRITPSAGPGGGGLDLQLSF